MFIVAMVATDESTMSETTILGRFMVFDHLKMWRLVVVLDDSKAIIY